VARIPSQKQGTDFEATSRKENPYSTDLVWQHLLYLFRTHSSTQNEENSSIKVTVQVVRPHLIFGHIFLENRTAFNAVTVRTVRLSEHSF
jgi:hypothetical protein